MKQDWLHLILLCFAFYVGYLRRWLKPRRRRGLERQRNAKLPTPAELVKTQAAAKIEAAVDAMLPTPADGHKQFLFLASDNWKTITTHYPLPITRSYKHLQASISLVNFLKPDLLPLSL